MVRNAIMILAVLAGSAAVHACYEPANVFGIQFNAGESVEPDIIKTMGEEGVNYRVNNINVYTFRGHYDPSVMVSLSTHGMSLVVDTSILQLESFPFGTCIRTELEWLVDVGILAMDRIAIERAERAYNDRNPSWFSIAGPVYWTKQDTLLVSSIWWVDEAEAFIEVDCAGSDGTVVLPPQSLAVALHCMGKNGRIDKQGKLTSLSGNNALYGFDISGRMVFQKRARGGNVDRSGVLLLYNRRAGVAKKLVTLP